ncbi:NIPSNAP family protein [Neptunicella sp. SCSIO 80796]|uniref:NIPSNAP family protein n=1 Tax=Neptunicella plasticusilytica TaxID=3117012 RepID=UPI003A4D9609
MTITCFIEYQLNPAQLEQFEQYASNWANIIPRCGGELIGYFMPHEGSNNIAYGLISFNSLADYEVYRQRLRQNPESKSNFDFAQQQQFILQEKRSFLRVIDNTYIRPANQEVQPC